MAFGLTEAILCIATIAQSFMLRLVPGHRVEVACRLTLRPGDRLPMQLVPRRPLVGAAVDAGTVPAMPAATEAPDGQAGCPYHGHSETVRQ